MLINSVMDSWTTEESGISDADDMHVNVTAKCDQMIFAAHYGGLGNQDSDLLSPRSMDTIVNHTVSCLSEKKFSHTSVPTGAQSWQGNKKIRDDIGQHLLRICSYQPHLMSKRLLHVSIQCILL